MKLNKVHSLAASLVMIFAFLFGSTANAVVNAPAGTITSKSGNVTQTNPGVKAPVGPSVPVTAKSIVSPPAPQPVAALKMTTVTAAVCMGGTTRSGNTCVNRNGVNSGTPSCPSGATYSAGTCQKTTYSCPAGKYLSGTTCK